MSGKMNNNKTSMEKPEKKNTANPVHIRFKQGKYEILNWKEAPNYQVDPPWKNEGVYLITGGTGGLGRIFMEDIVNKVQGATIVLTGRSELNREKSSLLQKYGEQGNKVEYEKVDVLDKQAVDELLQNIHSRHGHLNGIIHSAGINRDNLIVRKTEKEFQDVLAPKVTGLINLDEASKDMHLDFFVLFSSISGVNGNTGQADYAAANGFMDRFAEKRNEQEAARKRYGKTLSLNWPLWKEGGMQVDEVIEKMMYEKAGLKPLPKEAGLQAFYQGLESEKSQVLVVYGDKNRILGQSGQEEKAPKKEQPVTKEKDTLDNEFLTAKVQNALIQTVSKLLKLNEQDLDLDTDLSDYGFDSITFTEFVNQLNQDFDLDLNPTVFFEYPTLGQFTEFLIGDHGAALKNKFGIKIEEKPGTEKIAETVHKKPETEYEKPETEYEKPETEYENTQVVQKSTRKSPFISPGSPVTTEQTRNEPVAIIGMSGCFPMASDLDDFWDNLENGLDCITEIPRDRWDWREFYGDPKTQENKTNIKWGGFIEGIQYFDPLFFGISPKEAEIMDPQQRLLMQYGWKAIEDAGYSADSLAGSNTAVFVGTGMSGYGDLIARANIAIQGHSSTGMIPSVGPNRLSYYLDLHGPSEPVETACSSALVAVHRAVTAIHMGHCETALVGGINTIITPDAHIGFNKAGMLSEDGRCKTFSDQANGYVRGEGVGMLMLKSLKAAEAAGDHIYAVVLGSAVNHGGRANSLTAPNPKAQTDLLKTAYLEAGIDPRTVGYIEAHGTGTELGDPIEINGLKSAFSQLYKDSNINEVQSAHCGLGSVKTNIGHLELAAGAAGLIKVLLQMKHKTLVPSLHNQTINPYIDLNNSPFYLVREKEAWQPIRDEKGKEYPLRAGISSFGFGGVNAHLVVEEYIPPAGSEPAELDAETSTPKVIVLSARNPEALKKTARNLIGFLDKESLSDTHLGDIAYTLQVGRQAMEERLALLAGSIKELQDKLAAFLREAETGEVYRGHVKQNRDGLAIFSRDEDIYQLIDIWIKKGKINKIAELWTRGFAFDWNMLYDKQTPGKISLPTYPFARDIYWVNQESIQFISKNSPKASSAKEKEQKTKEIVKKEEFFKQDKKNSDSTGNYIFKKLEHILESVIGISGETIDRDMDWGQMGVDSIMSMQIIQKLEEEMDIKIYPNELIEHNTFEKFSHYLAGEYQNVRNKEKEIKKNELSINSTTKPVVYILSTPRSGSTLLRVMLDGHGELFAPPELHLLPFTTMAERASFLKEHNQEFLKEGLIKAYGELTKISVEESKQSLLEMEKREESIETVYNTLQDLSGPRYVVDKSPTYAVDMNILAKAEQLNFKPFYIHLIRHPLAVMESFVRNRFDKLLGIKTEDPWQLAGTLWGNYNSNIDTFLKDIPPERRITVFYEELVAEPEKTMKKVCELLNIEYEPQMIEPYQKKRMTDGLHEVSMSIGDPNFNTHKKIESSFSTKWEKHIDKVRVLDAKTIQLAEEYHYNIAYKKEYQLTPAQKMYFKRVGKKPDWLIFQHIDFQLDNVLDQNLLQKSFQSIVRENSALRQSFKLKNNQWTPAEPGDDTCQIHFKKLENSDEKLIKKEVAILEKSLQKEIAIEKGKMIAAAVLELNLNHYILVLAAHHLVTDGVSMAKIITRLFELYGEPEKLQNQPHHDYRIYSYSEEVNSLLNPDFITKHKQLWSNHIPRAFLTIPFDKPDPQGKNNTIGSEREYRISLKSEDLWQNFQGRESEKFFYIAAGLYRCLASWLDTGDITIAHRLHRRTSDFQQDYSDLVGWIAGDIPLKISLNTNRDSEETAAGIKELLRALPLGGTSYEMLAAEDFLPSIETICPVRLNYQPESRISKGIKIHTRLYENPTYKRLFILDCIVRQNKENTTFIIRYSNKLHTTATLKTFVQNWIEKIR